MDLNLLVWAQEFPVFEMWSVAKVVSVVLGPDAGVLAASDIARIGGVVAVKLAEAESFFVAKTQAEEPGAARFDIGANTAKDLPLDSGCVDEK